MRPRSAAGGRWRGRLAPGRRGGSGVLRHALASARIWLGAALLLLPAGCTGCVLTLPFGYTVNFAGFSGKPVPESQLAGQIRLPQGFSIAVYASGIENARMLRWTSGGDLLVSAPRQGKVFLVERDRSGRGAPSGQRVLLDGLNLPHGMTIRGDWLYVAENDAVLRVPFDAAAGRLTGSPERIIHGLPTGGNHWTRTIDVGPDGRLYLTMGSSCNVCIEKDPHRASMWRFNLDGSGEEIYATGLRNAVGFAWRPGTNELYATVNGRDLLGDDFPPDRFDRIVQGGFYGWPFANGDRVPDPDYGAGHEADVARTLPPAYALQAHVAPLGMTFYDARSFPARYRGAAFVAEHGSWNRSKKVGYKVVALFFANDGTIHEEDFVSGFMVDERVIGRPVDVAVGPDGALYVSDDFTGQIYRVAYGAAAAPAAAILPPVTPTAAPAVDPLASLDLAERQAAVARGDALWQEHECRTCHLPGGGGKTYRPLEGLGHKYGIEKLADYFLAPQPPMPVFDLSPAQRRDLAIYLLNAHP